MTEQDEWEEYFETYQKELLEIKANIDATDKQIDEMVYELYGLSEDEVAVVEGKQIFKWSNSTTLEYLEDHTVLF